MEETAERPNLQEPTPDFQTPFGKVTFNEGTKAIPEMQEPLGRTLTEIERQMFNTFSSFHSDRYPGVSFSWSKLEITPDFVESLGRKESKTPDVQSKAEQFPSERSGKNEKYFLFTPIAPPPSGSAFGTEDMAIDRFIREIPKVSHPMNNGEAPPTVEIYLLGAPTGFAGSVTAEWNDAVWRNGLIPHTELYTEFVRQHIPTEKEDRDNTRVVFQGASKGAVVAEHTSVAMKDELPNAQRLLDNPAGHHAHSQPWRGLQAGVGLGVEFGVRAVFDPTQKQMGKLDAPFLDFLSERTGIPKDDAAQAGLKQKAFLAELKALGIGSPLDPDTRSFKRQGILDPLTTSPRLLQKTNREKERITEAAEKDLQERIEAGKQKPWDNRNLTAIGAAAPIINEGKQVTVPFEGHHFYPYVRYDRWKQIFESTSDPASRGIPKDVSEIIGSWMVQQTRPDIEVLRQELSRFSNHPDSRVQRFATQIVRSLTTTEKFELSLLNSEEPKMKRHVTQWEWYKNQEKVMEEPGSIEDVNLKEISSLKKPTRKLFFPRYSDAATSMIKHEVGNRLTFGKGNAALLARFVTEGELGETARKIQTHMDSIVSQMSPLFETEGTIEINVNPDDEKPITITRIPPPPLPKETQVTA